MPLRGKKHKRKGKMADCHNAQLLRFPIEFNIKIAIL